MAFLSPGLSEDTCSREIHSYKPQIPLLISMPTLPSFSAVPAGDGDGCWLKETISSKRDQGQTLKSTFQQGDPTKVMGSLIQTLKIDS